MEGFNMLKKISFILLISLGILVAVNSAQKSFAGVPIPHTDLLPDMSDEEARLLNVFVSNFSEVSFNAYNDCNTPIDEDLLIIFGIGHTRLNNPGKVKQVGSSSIYLVSSSDVDNAAQRYFGRKISRHHTVSGPILKGRQIPYANGSYSVDIGDGDPYTWSNVINFYDNGDGTYLAVVQDYATHCFWTDNRSVYKRKKYWELGDCTDEGVASEGYVVGGIWKAIVAPHEYNGKKTYKLLKTVCN
jgi:hypothetical protein